MGITYQIAINGTKIAASRGELLLDAALKNGLDLPHQCRAGHCGTCCMRLISGSVDGGAGTEPGIVHACQCRITGNAALESRHLHAWRSVEGVLRVLRPVSSDVTEVGIKTKDPLPHHPGQYALVRFKGYPQRSYSFTHPILGRPDSRLLWFHIRHIKEGRVTSELGKRIRRGHRLTLTGPYGTACFQPAQTNRLLLVATNTGFAPIWAIAAAALRENPYRTIMIIAGGRTIESLYMAPALARLSNFPNVRIFAVCSRSQNLPLSINPGRPTDYLPLLTPTDLVYACGAPEMVDAVKSVASEAGAICYSDPFLPAPADAAAHASLFARAVSLIKRPSRPQLLHASRFCDQQIA
ncbi:MAG: 2Fe-2S iron-sulfur cluster binding domain-containing protein [Hyphomicrobiaceae bacterium]